MWYMIKTDLSRRKVREIACSTMRQYPGTEWPSSSLFRRPNVPNLKLPTFSGNYTEYTGFMSMFSTVIDKNLILADMTPQVLPKRSRFGCRWCFRGY